MKRMTLPLTLAITLLWASVQPPEVLGFSAEFLPMRKALISLSGSWTLIWMGVCMLLALRPVWLEDYLGGLDRMYHIHKWTGIGAVLLGVVHWLIALSPRFLTAWGWLTLPARGGKGKAAGFSLIGPGKEMGEWAIWIMIAVGLISILRFIPYHWFRKSHKAFPIAFLLGAFHNITMVVLHDKQGGTLYGISIIALSLVGGLIALYSLFNRIGSSLRHGATITRVTTGEAGVIDVEIQPDDAWPGHRAGQFALLTLTPEEGPHPFTIASAGGRGAHLRFAIKPLGDYTRTLPERLRVGDAVSIEGPYGRFDFGDTREAQVWVAGGIGIAPFLARLEQLAAAGGAQEEIHLFYCVAKASDALFPANLEALCRAANVTLHRHIDEHSGLIDASRIGAQLKQSASVWFCGPSRWGDALKDFLKSRHGLPGRRFNRELFEFR